ncbi:MAG: GAF domain-containing protein [Planctomycetota bacterium]
MADFYQVLQALADIGNAQGCILWEIISFGPAERSFFALAEYFPDGPSWQYLPLRSVTGDAVITEQEPQVVNDLEEAIAEGRVANPEDLRQAGVRAFCSMPISLGEQREAAVNLYRRSDQPFSLEDLERIRVASAAIPPLFDSVRNEMGFRLVREVENLLRQKGLDALQEILEKVTTAFDAIESAIYLEDPQVAPDVYSLRATVWPWDWEQNKQYRKADDAMTTWAIRNGRTLRFLDLSHFEEEVRRWGYEGVTCRNKEKLQKSVREYFKRETLPPLSFICAPIRDIGRFVGAIRCCVTRTGPHLFDDRYIEILEIVADQIGERWGTQLKIRQEAGEKTRFAQLTKGIDRLNAHAFDELTKKEGPSFARQMRRALDLLGEISGFGEALSIRLIDHERNELYFADWLGKRWEEGGDRRKAERTPHRYPLAGDFGGCRAIREKRVILDELAGQPGRLFSFLFPHAKRVLHAPILAGEDAIGVFDVRGFGDRPFPAYMDLIAGLVARQLGVHHHMFQQFQKLQQTASKLRKNLDEQNQIYDDFHHQISTPIQKVHILAQIAAESRRASEGTLRAMRGHARRAEQVAQNLKYFTALAKDELGKPELQILLCDRLVKRLKEMAEDQESVADPTKRLTFRLDADSLDALRSVSVRANLELLEHAVMNLLDNAAKYSLRQTTVSIRGGLNYTRSHFHISVTNYGYPILPEEKKKLVERGYRGDRARLTVVEGRGIGLYIVKRFMESMGGNLEIIPTDSRGLNEFRLVLPGLGTKGEEK